jgi:LemA protein
MSTYDNNAPTDERTQFRQEYATQQAQLEQKRRSSSRWKIGILAGVLLLGLIIGGSACSTYNTLATKRENVRAAFSNVDVQLQRRADLVPNLVNTVKGYTKHEEAVFSEIAQARSRLLNANTVDEKADANAQLSSSLGRLLVLQENYPNLKADQQFQNLMTQLEGTENRIGVARRDYNQVVVDYNTSRLRFPSVMMANLLGFQREEEFKAEPGSRGAPGVDVGAK